ncbi:MAG: hypothetical protein IJ051_07640, partial [Clostridia bacterium]|nr:hypothetical protein [Clostridia bacterium]
MNTGEIKCKCKLKRRDEAFLAELDIESQTGMDIGSQTGMDSGSQAGSHMEGKTLTQDFSTR